VKRVYATALAHRWFALAAAVCLFAFGWMVTGGTFQLDYRDSFGDVFDHQARSLLQGRLDVPKEVIGWEAFVVDGKHHSGFGLTPALLRLPPVVLDLGFGRLTRGFMLCLHLLALVAAYAVLCHVVGLAGRDRPPAWMVIAFTLNVGLGTALFFMASRAFVHHEGILCGAAFALVSGYCSLRYLAAPEKRWWMGALLAGLLSLHARVPTGLFALSLAAGSALAVLARGRFRGGPNDRKASLHTPIAIVVLGGACLFSIAGVSHLRFQNFEGSPIKYHIQFDAARLARVQGKTFHLANWRYNFDTFVWRPNLDVRPTFPYLYLGYTPLEGYPEARLDGIERTVALPYSMPGLVLFAGVGCLSALFRSRALRVPILVIAGATVPMAGMMFTFFTITHRYTGDFCPPLILLAAIGLAWLEGAVRRHRPLLYAFAAALTFCSVLVTLAITLQYQGEGIWGVPDDVKARYREMQHSMDGMFRFGGK
jgi:hypothetical protein